jgi:hypothetical protein
MVQGKVINGSVTQNEQKQTDKIYVSKTNFYILYPDEKDFTVQVGSSREAELIKQDGKQSEVFGVEKFSGLSFEQISHSIVLKAKITKVPIGKSAIKYKEWVITFSDESTITTKTSDGKEKANIPETASPGKFSIKRKFSSSNKLEKPLKELEAVLKELNPSPEKRLSRALNLLGGNETLAQIKAKYSNSRLTPTYALYCLEQELQLIKEQINAYDNATKELRSKLESPEPTDRTPAQNFINNAHNAIAAFKGKIPEMVKDFGIKFQPIIADVNAVETFQTSKKVGQLVFAEKFPAIEKFKSQILTESELLEVMDGKRLSGQQADLLRQIEDVIMHDNARSKVRGLLDTGMGKTFLAEKIAKYSEILKRKERNLPENFPRFASFEIKNIDLANQDQLLEMGSRTSGDGKPLKGNLIIVDEDFFINNKSLRTLVDKGAKVVRFGASENQLQLNEAFHRAKEKNIAGAKIKENEAFIKMLEGRKDENSRLIEIYLKLEASYKRYYSESAGSSHMLQSFNYTGFKEAIDELEKNNLIEIGKVNTHLLTIENDRSFKGRKKRADQSNINTETAIQKVLQAVKDAAEKKILSLHGLENNGEINFREHLNTSYLNRISKDIDAQISTIRAENDVLREPSQIFDSKVRIRENDIKAVTERRDLAKKRLKKAEVESVDKDKTWHDLAAENSSSNKSQNIFPGLSLGEEEIKKGLKAILEQTKKDVAVANFVEDGKHKIILAKKNAEGLIEHAVIANDGNKDAEIAELTKGTTSSVMIYAGEKLEFVVGGDYGPLSILAEGDRQNIFIQREKDLNIDLFKQMFGRDRGGVENISRKVALIGEVAKVKTAEGLADKSFTNSQEKDLSTILQFLQTKLKKYYKSDAASQEKFTTTSANILANGDEKNLASLIADRRILGNQMPQQLDFLNDGVDQEKFRRDLKAFASYSLNSRAVLLANEKKIEDDKLKKDAEDKEMQQMFKAEEETRLGIEEFRNILDSLRTALIKTKQHPSIEEIVKVSDNNEFEIDGLKGKYEFNIVNLVGNETGNKAFIAGVVRKDSGNQKLDLKIDQVSKILEFVGDKISKAIELENQQKAIKLEQEILGAEKLADEKAKELASKSLELRDSFKKIDESLLEFFGISDVVKSKNETDVQSFSLTQDGEKLDYQFILSGEPLTVIGVKNGGTELSASKIDKLYEDIQKEITEANAKKLEAEKAAKTSQIIENQALKLKIAFNSVMKELIKEAAKRSEQEKLNSEKFKPTEAEVEIDEEQKVNLESEAAQSILTILRANTYLNEYLSSKHDSKLIEIDVSPIRRIFFEPMSFVVKGEGDSADGYEFNMGDGNIEISKNGCPQKLEEIMAVKKIIEDEIAKAAGKGYIDLTTAREVRSSAMAELTQEQMQVLLEHEVNAMQKSRQPLTDSEVASKIELIAKNDLHNLEESKKPEKDRKTEFFNSDKVMRTLAKVHAISELRDRKMDLEKWKKVWGPDKSLNLDLTCADKAILAMLGMNDDGVEKVFGSIEKPKLVLNDIDDIKLENIMNVASKLIAAIGPEELKKYSGKEVETSNGIKKIISDKLEKGVAGRSLSFGLEELEERLEVAPQPSVEKPQAWKVSLVDKSHTFVGR